MPASYASPTSTPTPAWAFKASLPFTPSPSTPPGPAPLNLYAFENWSLHQDLTQIHLAEIKTLETAHLDVINSLFLKNFAARKRIQEMEAQIEELQKQIKLGATRS